MYQPRFSDFFYGLFNYVKLENPHHQDITTAKLPWGTDNKSIDFSLYKHFSIKPTQNTATPTRYEHFIACVKVFLLIHTTEPIHVMSPEASRLISTLLSKQDQRPTENAVIPFNQKKTIAISILREYLSPWKIPFFGHHHDARAESLIRLIHSLGEMQINLFYDVLFNQLCIFLQLSFTALDIPSIVLKETIADLEPFSKNTSLPYPRGRTVTNEFPLDSSFFRLILEILTRVGPPPPDLGMSS